jgi:UDP-glucuronate 4-epimerase
LTTSTRTTIRPSNQKTWCLTYSHLYDLCFIALRFLTVYGDGTTRRDYTYVADIVRGIRAAMAYNDESYAVMNVGSGEPIEVNDMIDTLERVLGQPPKRNHRPEQPGDVPQTWADISRAKRLLGYEPQVDFEDGVDRFVDTSAGRKTCTPLSIYSSDFV